MILTISHAFSHLQCIFTSFLSNNHCHFQNFTSKMYPKSIIYHSAHLAHLLMGHLEPLSRLSLSFSLPLQPLISCQAWSHGVFTLWPCFMETTGSKKQAITRFTVPSVYVLAFWCPQILSTNKSAAHKHRAVLQWMVREGFILPTRDSVSTNSKY